MSKDKNIKLIPYIRRRVPGDVLLDEFYDSLEYLKEWFEREYRDGEIISFSTFEYRLLSVTMDSIHWRLLETTPDDVEWYDYAFDGLKEFFGKSIRREYNKLIEKKGLLPLNENVSKKNKLEDKMTEFLYKLTKDDKFPETFKEFKLELVYNPYNKNTNLYIISIMEPGFTTRKEFPSDELTINNIVYGHLNQRPSLFRSAFGGFFNMIYKECTTEKDLPKLMRYIRGEDMHFKEITKAQQQTGHDDNWVDNLLEDLKPWGVSNATKNKYKMGPLDEEEDLGLKIDDNKLKKYVDKVIDIYTRKKNFPESFLKFETFIYNPFISYSNKSWKTLFLVPIFKEEFINTPYEDYEFMYKHSDKLEKILESTFKNIFTSFRSIEYMSPEQFSRKLKDISKRGEVISSKI